MSHPRRIRGLHKQKLTECIITAETILISEIRLRKLTNLLNNSKLNCVTITNEVYALRN